ncbi:MAG: BlaI/MecI/CopY family transcriptional regulator [bacterium]
MPEELTKTELWLLNHVYELGEGTVYTILDRVKRHRDWKYTTVLTLLQKLTQKGYLQTRKEGRRHIFTPIHPRTDVVESFIKENFGNTLEYDPSPLVSYLLKVKKMNKKDEKMLRELLGVDPKSS